MRRKLAFAMALSMAASLVLANADMALAQEPETVLGGG